MRIGVYPHDDSSGIGTYVQELSTSLSETDHEIVVFGNQPAQHADEFVKIPLEANRSAFIRHQKRGRKIQSAIGRYNIDLFHTASPPEVSIFPPSVPIVTTAWFYPVGLFSGTLTTFRRFDPRRRFSLSNTYESTERVQYQLMDRVAYRNADTVIAATKEVQNSLSQIGYKSEYIPPSINSEDSCHIKFPSQPFPLYFVAARVSEPRKRFDTVISAISMIKNYIADDINIELNVFGNKTSKARDLVKRNNIDQIVSFHGYTERNKILAAFSEGGVLIAPSSYEEFGYILIEAMSRGIPVVGSAIPSFKEIIGDRAGDTINPNDTGEFAEAIISYVKSPSYYQKSAQAAQMRVAKKYSWNQNLPKLINIYHGITQ